MSRILVFFDLSEKKEELLNPNLKSEISKGSGLA